MSLEVKFDADTAVTIATAISDWVDAESRGSTDSVNAYLDGQMQSSDFEQVRASMGLPLHDPKNFPAQKQASHQNRQRLWGEAMLEKPENDFFTARHIFNILMQLSGGARRLNYFRATGREDYLERKLRSSLIGVDVEDCVSRHISASTNPVNRVLIVPDAPAVQEATTSLFLEHEKTLEDLRGCVPGDFGQEESKATELLQAGQIRWLGLATSSILMVAGYREGQISAVPFLEPKSISDNPAIYYPMLAIA